jgi:hypothetical protein
VRARAEQSCVEGGDCCDGHCDELAGACACYADGSSCQEHTDCCNNNCNAGFCGDAICPDLGTPCVPGDDTCCPIDNVAACQQDNRTGNGEFVCCDTGSCAHTVCVAGGPLLPVCGCPQCQDDSATTTPERCIQTICNDYLPHCCCFGWDDACTAAAEMYCGAICEAGGVEVEGTPMKPFP